MATVTIKQHVHASRSYDGQISYSLFAAPFDQHGYIPLFEQEFTIEIPDDFDLNDKEVQSLKAEKARIQAEAQMEITRIEERIRNLLCIEHKPIEAA